MQSPLEISFRNMDRSDAVEARVRENAEKLEQVFDRITSCRVVVEATHRHHHKGNLYHVSIDHAHEDVYVAVRDAFKAARRRLEDHAERRAGKVKTHEVPPTEDVV